MAKDPAFLFYTQDFITGSLFMSNEDTGIYIRLLCAQHQHGGLIDKLAFNSMVGTKDLLRSKFIETDDGFFNKRLMEEMTKREKKSSNLSANAKIRWSKQCKSNAIAYAGHMPTEDENEIVNEVKNVVKKGRVIKGRGFKKPTIEEVRSYCQEIKTKVDPDLFFNTYESQGWIKSNKLPVLNWKSTIKTWEKRDERTNTNKNDNRSANERSERKKRLDSLGE